MRANNLGFFAIVLVATSASIAPANAILTDVYHASTEGGVWNDDSTGNWGIWIAPGTDPTLTTAAQILNPGNPVGTTAVYLHNGTNNLIMFKESCCGGGSADDKLTFNIGTLDLGNAAGAYKTTNVAPTAIGLTLGGPLTPSVTVENFSWYESNVFSRDLVGSGQSFAPSGTNDQIALVTLLVTPEPSSWVLGGLGAMGLMVAARRHRKA